ncbi:hypothetical protein BN1708_019857, partial [Verticillium longisporum]
AQQRREHWSRVRHDPHLHEPLHDQEEFHG